MEATTSDPAAARAVTVRLYASRARPWVAAAQAAATLNAVAVAAALARAAAVERVALPPASVGLELLAVTVLPWAVARAVRGRPGVAAAEGSALRLTTKGRRIEVPLTPDVEARAWRIPLPAPGVTVRTSPGRALPWAVESDDPGALVERLDGAARGTAGRARPLAPAVAWARARARLRPRRAERALRSTLLPVAIAAVLFRADQLIVYGGALGAWQARGPAAWLRGLAAHLVASAAGLLLVAAIARALGELGCAAWTALAPAHAERSRRAAEGLVRLALYALPPALLAARFLG